MSQTKTLPQMSPKLHTLAEALNDLLRHKKSGAALPECYGDEVGAEHWASFVRQSDPSIQYTFQSEVTTIQENGSAIASLLLQDPDLDKKNLIIVEKGGGSGEALRAKSFKLMDCFRKAAMNVGFYVNLERSESYRAESLSVAAEQWPKAKAIALDVDFNSDNPDLGADGSSDIEAPRIVMELGSSRSNIPTLETDQRTFSEQAYAELQQRFSHDRKLCRDGGVLIVGSDANQDESSRAAYMHPEHSNFAENIVYRGVREGALSQDLDPQLLHYAPLWDKADHVVRHTLIAQDTQNFGIMTASGRFSKACIKKDERFVLSHSIKWPPKKMIAAAESQGFKCLGLYWGHDRRVPVYVFKAVSQSGPTLKFVA